MSEKVVIIAGLGEVGRPLSTILKRTYRCVDVDIDHVDVHEPCSVLHVCYPFQIHGFDEVTTEYARKYRPELIIINSTLQIGTTRRIESLVHCPVVFSPVRGKHAKMEKDLQRYKKFVAGTTQHATQSAADHFRSAGFAVDTFPTPESAELSKLLETTWLGLLVGWAQEIERIAERYGANYSDVNAFIEEVDFLPSHTFPGVIGGHCVMPNIAILRSAITSKFLDAIVESNDEKRRQASENANETHPAPVADVMRAS